jgi:O-acetylhomoserine (thiol)-lyase
MSRSSYLKPDTVALHSGYVPESDHGSRAVPVYQTTSYVFESVSEGSSLFNVEQGGHIYSRITNPTVAVLEQRIAALEGGSGAICTASGMSALFTTFITLCSAGDHLVSATQIYGSTATLLKHTIKRLGIDCTFVPINDEQALRDAIQDNTKMVFCESIGNPGLDYQRDRARGRHPAGSRRHFRHPDAVPADRPRRRCGGALGDQVDGRARRRHRRRHRRRRSVRLE